MRGEAIGWRHGIVVATAENRIILDAVSGHNLSKDTDVFVTHAHADHLYGLKSKSKKYATAETFEIYEQIVQKPTQNRVPVRVGEKVKIGDITVVPLNAGHMLGSVQFLIELPEKTVLYTGDVNCVSTLTTQQADAARCDELIIEATYGNPFYVFPPRQLIYARIVEWATKQARSGHVPTFRVYAAGKAQEVVRIINEYTKLKVLTCSSVSRVNEAHSKHGVNLEYVDLEDNDSQDQPSACVATYARNIHIPERSIKAVATGWALGSRSRDFAFPLSSHADFGQLVEYVKNTRAKRVYVYTGYADVFCRYLSSKLGISASPLPILHQRELLDFEGGRSTSKCRA